MKFDLWVEKILLGGKVKRFHTQTLIKSQDVAQHSFNCALFVHHFAVILDSKDIDPYRVTMHMLLHDIPEQYIGDSPYHIKQAKSEIKDALNSTEYTWIIENMPIPERGMMNYLTRRENGLCKFVDQFDALCKGIEEVKLGNSTFKPLVVKMANVCSEIIDEYGFEKLNPVMSELTGV